MAILTVRISPLRATIFLHERGTHGAYARTHVCVCPWRALAARQVARRVAAAVAEDRGAGSSRVGYKHAWT